MFGGQELLVKDICLSEAPITVRRRLNAKVWAALVCGCQLRSTLPEELVCNSLPANSCGHRQGM